MTGDSLLQKILQGAVTKADLWGLDQQLSFPIITKYGVNQNGKTIHYYFNYSAAPVTFIYPHSEGKELLLHEPIQKNKQLKLAPWGVKIIEEH